MRYVSIATSILIAGFILRAPVADAAAAEQQGKPVPKRLETQAEEQQGKPGRHRVDTQDERPATGMGMPVYKPPLRGAPIGRVAGGTRGVKTALPLLAALVPDHVGLTVQEQPSLYWYLSASVRSPIVFTLVDEKTIQPLLETTLDIPGEPGVQRLRLVDYGIRLVPAVQYQWFVAMVLDPDHRSKDVVAGGAIERIALSATLREKLAQASEAETPHLYAAAGLWYDALMAISARIEAAPHDAALRKQRAALLEQVELADIATHELTLGAAAGK